MNSSRQKLAVPKQSNFAVEEARGIPIEKVIEPYPLQKRVSLLTHSPEIAAQWLYEKNCGWGPEDFSFGSGINVWWRCDQGPDHIWRQLICARASLNRGCPYCANQKVSVTNSLAVLNPKLAKSWHPTKNTAKPSEVTAASSYLAWWICKKKHEWTAVVNNRSMLGSGCPTCHDDKRIEGLSDYPEYLKYFDYAKNKGIDPMRLLIGKKVWWKCDKAKDHRWQMGFWKTHATEVCPFCRGYRASSTNNLTLAKNLMKEFHPSLNGDLKPKEIPLLSGTFVFWQCHRCAHVWKARVGERYEKGYGCRKCSQAARRVPVAKYVKKAERKNA